LTLLTFLAGTLAVIGIYSVLSDLFLRDRSRISQRLDEEFRKRQRDQVRRSTLFRNLGQSEAAADELAETRWTYRFEALVEQSGLDLTPRKLLLIAGSLGLGLGALVGLVRQSQLLGTLAGLLGLVAPIVYVALKRRARIEKLLSQLPDAFDLMARVIRAGHTTAQALQAVADEFDAPIAAEFSYCYEQQNLGLSPELALRDLARRTGLLEIKIFVLAMMVQQQTGGNLAHLLDKLATVVRERFRIRGKIKTLTAEGRLQALVLLILPPALFFIILMLNWSYGEVLLSHPYLLVGMIVAELVGALWIRKVVHFDF
jgi:tight adherence protein B